MTSSVPDPGPIREPIVSRNLSIPGVATAIAAFVGWAPQGPTGVAQLVTSWVDFAKQFGGLDGRSFLGYAVFHFFANGGGQAYIIRIPSAADGTVLAPASTSGSSPGAFEAAVLPGSPLGVDLLESVDLFNILCVPGEADPATLHSLARFCGDQRAMLIADCYQDATYQSAAAGIPAPFASDDSGANAALYFPWVKAPDPLSNNQPRVFPPCGFVAGIWARNDQNQGVWRQPAGPAAGLVDANGVSVPLTDQASDVLDSMGINGIRSFPTLGTVVWGGRTVIAGSQPSSDWIYISVRRMMIFIEQSLYNGLEWVMFEPNDDALWAKIRQDAGNFMEKLFRQGAFQGPISDDAYFVKCDAETTTQDDIDQGIVNIVVGFAPLEPAEFVVIQITQLAGQ